MNNNINNLFASWGEKERRLPASGDKLKKEILLKFGELSFAPTRVYSHSRWPSIAFAGAAAFTLLIAIVGSDKPVLPLPQMTQNFMSSGGELDYAPTEEQEKSGYPSISAPPAPMRGSYDSPSAPGAQSVSMGGSPIETILPYPQYDTDISITDTREFLKINYHATIRTRHVQELTDRIQITVRGFKGRVDSASDSERFGSVSFVVPANKFEEFRTEIATFTNHRFIVEQTGSENLLSQKQSIESEQKSIGQNLSELRADRAKLIANHTQAVTLLNSQLSSVRNELYLLAIEKTNDPTRKAQIAARTIELQDEERLLIGNLSRENTDYTKKLSSLDARIREYDNALVRVDEKDQDLLDSVATVRGTISLRFISIWELIDAYLPLYWIAILLALGSIASHALTRRRL